MASSNGGGAFLPGLFIGAILGGAAALIMTQEETRDMLFGKAREAGNLAADASGDLREKFGGATAQWQSGVGDLYARGRAVVDNARATLDDALSQSADASERLRQELHDRAGA